MWSSNPTPEYLLSRNEKLCSHQKLYRNVLASLHNHQKLQITQKSFSGWINKLVDPHSGIVYCSAIRRNYWSCNYRDGFQKHYTEGKIPVSRCHPLKNKCYHTIWSHSYDILEEPKQRKDQWLPGIGVGERGDYRGRFFCIWFLYHCGGYRSQYMW